MSDVVNGASMKKSALVALKAVRSTWKGLKTIRFSAAASTTGLASFAVDSVPLPP
jgi:hypothetical protein